MGWMSAIMTPTRKRVALNYKITQWRQEVRSVWRPNPLVTRCSRESQSNGTPGLRFWAAQGKRERNAVSANRCEGQYCVSYFSISNSLSHTNLSKKGRWYIFSKNCVARRLHCVVVFCMHIYMYYVNDHGYTILHTLNYIG